MEIVINGAGLVGQLAALIFAKQGHEVGLIEPFPKEIKIQDQIFSNVVALNSASIKLLKYAKVWEHIDQNRISEYKKMHVWDQMGYGKINFDLYNSFDNLLGIIIEVPVLHAALSKAVSCEHNIKVFFNKKIIDYSYDNINIIELNDQTKLNPKLLIAAEGKRSWLRDKKNIATKTTEYNQSAITCILKSTKQHNQTAIQRFTQQGPLALLPLKDPNLLALVFSANTKLADDLFDMQENVFIANIINYSDNYHDDFKLISNKNITPLSALYANKYIDEGFVMVGDAAHHIHPLAGQGVNLGFLDVALLAEQIKNSKKKQRRYWTKLNLTRYQAKRHFHNKCMLSAMNLFKSGFGSASWHVQLARNFGLNFVNKQSTLKQLFISHASGMEHLPAMFLE